MPVPLGKRPRWAKKLAPFFCEKLPKYGNAVSIGSRNRSVKPLLAPQRKKKHFKRKSALFFFIFIFKMKSFPIVPHHQSAVAGKCVVAFNRLFIFLVLSFFFFWVTSYCGPVLIGSPKLNLVLPSFCGFDWGWPLDFIGLSLV